MWHICQIEKYKQATNCYIFNFMLVTVKFCFASNFNLLFSKSSNKNIHKTKCITYFINKCSIFIILSSYQNLLSTVWLTPFSFALTFSRILPAVAGFIFLVNVNSFTHCVRIPTSTSAHSFTLPKYNKAMC